MAIAAVGDLCVAVKLQLACFERLGSPGWRALEDVARDARERGLLVIADGKRGDVPVTARAYAQALVGATDTPWGSVAGLGADAFTANVWLGRDSLEPLIEAAVAARAGCFCLVRTSNPGAADLQDLNSNHAPLFEHVARMVAALAEAAGEGDGLSAVGAVVGATHPEHIARLRELMPRSIFLVPGVGAQGGRSADLAPAFGQAGPAGALVTASRSIVDAHRGATGDPAAAARSAAAELRGAVWAASSRN